MITFMESITPEQALGRELGRRDNDPQEANSLKKNTCSGARTGSRKPEPRSVTTETLWERRCHSCHTGPKEFTTLGDTLG